MSGASKRKLLMNLRPGEVDENYLSVGTIRRRMRNWRNLRKPRGDLMNVV